MESISGMAAYTNCENNCELNKMPISFYQNNLFARGSFIDIPYWVCINIETYTAI